MTDTVEDGATASRSISDSNTEANASAALRRQRRSRFGIACVLMGTILFTCLPLFSGYIPYSGHDLVFHLSRIEGIYEGLLSGQFPVKIEPALLNGAGYATSVFYPDLFLYLPAVLRLLGASVVVAWDIFVACMNVACCLVSYWCFKRIFSSRAVGAAGSFLYCASLYRVVDVFLRAAVGEALTFVFLPLIIYGTWKMYAPVCQADDRSAGIAGGTGGTARKRTTMGTGVAPLVIGLSGIMESHVLSVEMVGLFLLAFVLIFWRQTFTKSLLTRWLKIIGIVLIVNLWFLIPFLDYLQGDFEITDPTRTLGWIQDDGILLQQYFSLVVGGSGDSLPASSGTSGEMPLGQGIALLLGAVLFIVCAARGRLRQDATGKMKITVLVLGLIALAMTSNLFPWDWIGGHIGPLKALVSNIQFPWRFLMVATALLVCATCAALKMLLGDFGAETVLRVHAGGAVGHRPTGKRNMAVAAAVLAGLTLITSGSFMISLLGSASAYTGADLAYDLRYSPYRCIVWGEYLPGSYDAVDCDELIDQEVSASSDITVTDYSKDYLTVTVNAQAIETTTAGATLSDDAAGYVDVPLLYYPSYVATDTTTGEQLAISMASDDNDVIRIEIPAGYSGSFVVRFVEPWYWRVGEAVSTMAIVIFIGIWLWRRKSTCATAHHSPPLAHPATMDS